MILKVMKPSEFVVNGIASVEFAFTVNELNVNVGAALLTVIVIRSVVEYTFPSPWAITSTSIVPPFPKLIVEPVNSVYAGAFTNWYYIEFVEFVVAVKVKLLSPTVATILFEVFPVKVILAAARIVLVLETVV